VPSTHGVCLSNGPWADVRLNFEYGRQWVTAECPLREVNVFLPSRCDRLSGGRRAPFGRGGLDRISVLATHGLGRHYILPAEWAKLIANMPKVTDHIL